MRTVVGRSGWFAILLILFSVVGCSIQKNPVTGNTRAFGYSWQEEIQLGQENDPQIVAQFGLYEDESLAGYVREIGDRMLVESHLRRPEAEEQWKNTEFAFRVLDSPVINAFALPGGYIYFTRGILAHFNNEAQFAVVMGHEIGHVAARHASQRALRQTLGQVAVVGGSILGQEVLGLPGESLMNLSSQAAQLLFLSYSRENERESDRLGVEYAARSGYEASEGSALFTTLKRISEKQGQSVPGFVSTHPDPGEREREIPEMSRQWEAEGYEQTERNQDEYMEMIDGIIFGENPRNGIQEGDLFVHPDLAFQWDVPANWELLNEPSRVVMVSPEQEAVTIMGMPPDADSPRALVESFVQSEGITVTEQGEMDRSDGRQAWYAVADATLQDGTEVRLRLDALSHNEAVLQFLSYTTSDQFDDWRSTFESISSSFQDLEDPELLSVQPVRLHVNRANRNGTLASFLPDELPMNIEPEDVAILNQMNLEDEVERGQWLKIPVQE
ncbi:MAG: M48 family metalloprotease [Balneolaceae bacterium]